MVNEDYIRLNIPWKATSGTTGRIRVWQRYADIIHEIRPNPHPLKITMEYEESKIVNIDPEGYHQAFDVLFPNYPHDDDHSMGCYLLKKTGVVLELRNGPIEVMALPLLQEQAFSIASEKVTLTGIVNTQTYKITIAHSSWKIFTVFSFSILIWCTGLLMYSGFNRVPEVSSFPELDLISKLSFTTERDSDSSRLSQVAAQFFENKLRHIAKGTYGVKLRAEEDKARNGIALEGGSTTEVIELQNRISDSTTDNKH